MSPPFPEVPPQVFATLAQTKSPISLPSSTAFARIAEIQEAAVGRDEHMERYLEGQSSITLSMPFVHPPSMNEDWGLNSLRGFDLVPSSLRSRSAFAHRLNCGRSQDCGIEGSPVSLKWN